MNEIKLRRIENKPSWYLPISMYSIVQHELNDAQKDGIYKLGFDVINFPSDEIASKLKQSPSDEEELHELVDAILEEVGGRENILCPGGSPAFNAIFSTKAILAGKTLWFSHSVREFEEVKNEDGSVEKKNVFKHKKFIRIEGEK